MCIKKIVLSLAMIGAMVLPIGAHADELVVSATGIPTPAPQTGAVVNVITAEDLAEQQITYLQDALHSVGINVPQTGGVGTQSNIFLRGLPGRYSTLIADGISLFDPGANQVIWNDITTDGIARVEVLRGSHSVLYGSNAVNGVVVQNTAIGGARSNTFKFEGGAMTTWHAALAGQGQLQLGNMPSDYGYALSHFTTGGISAADERQGNSEQDGYRNTTLRWRSDTHITDALTLEAAAYGTLGRLDYDGGFPLQDADKKSEFRRYALRIGAHYKTNAVHHRVNVQHYNSNVEEFDNDQSTGERTATSDYFTYHGNARVHNAVQLVWGGEAKTNRFENTVQNFLGAQSFIEHDVSTYAAYLLAHITPLHGLALTGAVRHDKHDLFGGAPTWRVSAAFTQNNFLTWRALYATGYRAPTLFELFADTYGNRSLQPEASTNQEFGVDMRFADAASVSLTAFDIKIDDLIGYDPRSFRSVQIGGRTHAQGIEAMLKGQWRRLKTQAYLTYTDSRTPDASGASRDARQPRVPRWQGGVRLTYAPTARAHYGISLHHARDTVDAGNIALDDYWLVHVRASYQLAPNVQIYARLDNLLDDDYQLISNYGTPRRAGKIGFRVNF